MGPGAIAASDGLAWYGMALVRAGRREDCRSGTLLTSVRAAQLASEPCSKIKVCFNKCSQPMVGILELLRALPGKHL